MRQRLDDIRAALGPGILYAAISVGASHLVQSTRAGAAYGLGLLGLIGLTFVFKYPAFRFGAQYAAITGSSLLHGYRKEGLWAVAVYAVIAVGTMFAAVPAVTLVTAGLAKVAFGLPGEPLAISLVILAVSTAVLVGGGYDWLNRLVKLLMLLLAVTTLLATILVLPDIEWRSAARIVTLDFAAADVFFLVALLGLMPSSVDISVWHSLWSVAQSGGAETRPKVRDALVDFHVGYWGSLALAVCFVFLGAGVMYGTGEQFADGATGFAGQLIALYTASLGGWSEWLIGGVAMAVMLSTVLTGLDGYPRVAVTLAQIHREQSVGRPSLSGADERRIYIAAIGVLVVGSIAVLYLFVTSLRLVIDVASTIMFLFAPIVAYLNHRVMTRPELPPDARPGPALRILSLLGIVWMGMFSAYYLFLRFVQS